MGKNKSACYSKTLSKVGRVAYGTQRLICDEIISLKPRLKCLLVGKQFLHETKGKPVPQFNDPDWLRDFLFLADITLLLNDLNGKLYLPL